jgi:hypothetical protein
MEKVFDSKFFDHLQGLKTTCAYKLSYVFTSYKKLYDLNSKIFDRNTLTSFSSKIYFKPAKPIDAQVILKMFLKKYKLNISDSLIDSIITLSGGHTHIMLILVIILSELDSKKISNEEEIKKIFLHDERFKLQADELIAHLNKKEIEIVKNIIINPKIKIETDNYLRQSGFITLTNEDEYRIFSPLLRQYLSEHYFKVIINNNHKFTHKENLLFSLLLQNIDQVVEREDIMENVWPEQETYEISDWSLDKLISRLRNKLKIQNSNFQLNTIKTRGFMLSKKS